MPSTLLSLATPTTGTESGTWGDLVNNGLTSYLDIAIAGGLSITITTTDVTLTNTSGTNAATGITSTTAQYAILNISGAKTAARNLNLPASSRHYIINNNGTGGFLLTVRGTTPTTGITLVDGEKAVIAWNGTDYVKIASTPFNMGIGSGNVASNLVYGKSALASNTTGSNNLAIGQNALAVTTTASANTAVGTNALAANTTGYQNTAIGSSALTANTTGYQSVAFGYNALVSNTTGVQNTAVGTDALAANTTGTQNIAIGVALSSNTTGNSNIGIGSFALSLNSTGNFNIGIGKTALTSNSSGYNNIAIGREALYTNTTGYQNIGIGDYALTLNTSGDANVAIGQDALNGNTTGYLNTAIGESALKFNTTGNINTAIGSRTLLFCTTGVNNTAVGFRALYNVTTGSNNIAIAPYNSYYSVYSPVFDPTTQDNRICMGSTYATNAYIQVAWTVVSDARDKTDFAPVPHGLDFVCKLKPTAYRYKINREATEGHGPVRYGFKAQEVLAEEGAKPVIVDNEDPEKLRFNDQSMIAVLVNAIKEQTQIIKTLSNRVAQLESKA